MIAKEGTEAWNCPKVALKSLASPLPRSYLEQKLLRRGRPGPTKPCWTPSPQASPLDRTARARGI
jgi:hypothetical protein